MRRSPRLFLVPLFLVAMLFSGGVSSPASAGAAQITGFADENMGSWPGPAWAAMNNTGVKQVRHIVPWNVANNAGELASLHAWVNTAEAHGLSVLISFNHSGSTPPSTTDYLNAVSKFRTEFPNIREYTAWNEPNHHPSDPAISNSNPAGIGKAALAADYWVNLHYQCQAPKYGPTCTVAAGDFLESNDIANFNAYIDAYKKRIAEYGLSPSVWAIHPYGAIASGSWSAINATFIPRTEGKPIWFTEVGAKVCDTKAGLVGGSYPAAQASQNVEAGRLLSLIWSLGPRLARTYYYFLSASNPGQIECPNGKGEFKWDTALLDANGFPRPAFKTLFPAAAHLPTVSTGSASGIEQTNATISGSVDPRGYHSYYTFEYGTTTAYGSSIESQYVGFEPGAVGRSTTISGLQPGTTYHYRIRAWNSHGPTWGADQTFKTLGVGQATSSWALSDWVSGTQWLYYANAAGNVAQLYWNGSSWNGGAMGGNVRTGTTPTVVRDQQSNMQWVYYVNNSGEIAQWVWNGTTWLHFNMGGNVRTGTTPSVVRDPASGTQWVYYVNNSGEIAQWVWNGTTWLHFNVGSSVQPNSSVTAVMDPASGTQWLYYANAAGNVAQLYWNGSSWNGGAMGGNVRTGTTPTVVRDQQSNMQWVYYVNNSGEIAQWVWNGTTWLHFNVGSSVQPNSSVTAVMDPASGTQWLYYANAAGNVAQLYWNGSSWNGGAMGGNVRTGTTPTALRDPLTGTQRVYYLTTTGGISQWLWNGVTWVHFVVQ